MLLRSAPGPAEGRQAAKLLPGPASSHLPQGSGPNTERVKRRENTQERGHLKKKKKKSDLYTAEVLERWGLVPGYRHAVGGFVLAN